MVAHDRPGLSPTSLPAGATEMTIKQVVATLDGKFPTDEALFDGKLVRHDSTTRGQWTKVVW